MTKPHIEIIFPAGAVDETILQRNLTDLNEYFTVYYQHLTADPAWPYCSADIPARSEQLNTALLNDNNDIILCARGGYGCSDLLDLIPWSQLSKSKPKMVVGFSDISALLAAVTSKLGWPVIHGPMPGSPLWGQDADDDIQQLITLMQGQSLNRQLNLTPLRKTQHDIQGQLFGGCLSVLSNLIGAAYLPALRRNTILFFEDTGENPGQVMRHLNQWQQSGLLAQAQALILGRFLKASSHAAQSEQLIQQQILQRTTLPIYVCAGIGHQSPNYPLAFAQTVTLSSTMPFQLS